MIVELAREVWGDAGPGKSPWQTPPEEVWQAAEKPVTLEILPCTVSEERDIRLTSGARSEPDFDSGRRMLIQDLVAWSQRPSQTSHLETFESSSRQHRSDRDKPAAAYLIGWCAATFIWMNSRTLIVMCERASDDRHSEAPR